MPLSESIEALAAQLQQLVALGDAQFLPAHQDVGASLVAGDAVGRYILGLSRRNFAEWLIRMPCASSGSLKLIFSFTHDLVALMDWLEESGSDVSAFEQIADLSFFAVQTRYDDTVEISSPDWPLLLDITASLIDQVQLELS